MIRHPQMWEDVFARVDGGADETRHDTSYYWDNSKRSESNRINLQRTLSGEGFFENETGRYSLPVGTLIAFTQRENSRYGYPATASRPYRLRYLSIDPSATATPLFNRIRRDFGSVLSMPEGSESCTLFDDLFQRFHARNFLDRYHESELVTRLLTAIYRQQVSDTQHSDPVEYGYHLLRNRFTSPITLKEIAATCGISREHFIRSFSQRYQQAPGAVLRQLRLQHARGLLETTHLTLERIARASGFSSSNVFCRAFRQAFGTTPSKHREAANLSAKR
ncbi:helix-turn-helix transcriptional regulator [Pelagicoccus enzymogenes]|uniref:AraC family transcriptional regulator n=1 Tax=Pelagicoccus enzymogenes TaxID=2773457 RepID=UPI00280DDD53|nr:helix-turn-helix transcriptional regulator [Pelagicoccus enzymogenes]MDQ8199837.1 helix-turn-helix transcriptional regulator [Pelagicoccus enzymogenes]